MFGILLRRPDEAIAVEESRQAFEKLLVRFGEAVV
jgi:hypothetical protein